LALLLRSESYPGSPFASPSELIDGNGNPYQYILEGKSAVLRSTDVPSAGGDAFEIEFDLPVGSLPCGQTETDSRVILDQSGARGEGPFVPTHELLLRFPSGMYGRSFVRLFPDAEGDGPAYQEREWSGDSEARWQRRAGVWLLDGAPEYGGQTLEVRSLVDDPI